MGLRILWRPSQPLARQTNPLPVAVVPVLGIDIDAVGTDTLRIAAIVLFVLFSLSNLSRVKSLVRRFASINCYQI
jgi:hypothetical protein